MFLRVLLYSILGLLGLACGRVAFDPTDAGRDAADSGDDAADSGDATDGGDTGPPSYPPGVFEATEVGQLAGANYGLSTALSEDFMVVGAPTATRGGQLNAGLAYVFPRLPDGSLGPGHLLLPEVSEAEARFGDGVAIAGDRVIVSASKASFEGGLNVGAAYVFAQTAGTWAFQQVLRAGDASPHDYFGFAIAAAGDTLVVGSRYDDPISSESGSAYIFEVTGGAFSESQKLVPLVGGLQSAFGTTVAMSRDGSAVVIGAPFHDTDGVLDMGAAYVFERRGAFVEVAMLQPSVGQAQSYFGEAVAIDGRWAMIAAPQEDAMGQDSGAVYFFDGADGWSENASFGASEGEAGNQYGRRLALSGNLAFGGEPYGDSAGEASAGKIFLYRHEGGAWAEVGIQLSLTGAGSHFGSGLSALGNSLAVGAHRAGGDGRALLIHL